MVFTQGTYRCEGCGREKKSFFGEGFDIRVEEYMKKKNVNFYYFCNWKCLEKWLNKEGKDES